MVNIESLGEPLKTEVTAVSFHTLCSPGVYNGKCWWMLNHCSQVLFACWYCSDNRQLMLMLTAGGCKVSTDSNGSLEITAQFLGCDKMELNASLVSRMMQTPVGGRRGSSIMCVSHCRFFFLWILSAAVLLITVKYLIQYAHAVIHHSNGHFVVEPV